MPKNIVICADGTGNSAIKDRGTNVFKLYEAIDRHGHLHDPALVQQVAIYHDGVGTENFKWLRIASGATGWGLSRNVKQLYAELARIYDPGDRIFLFGFSRGAFTVRTLAGLIGCCGILDIRKPGLNTNREFWRAVKKVYAAYRTRYEAWLTRLWRALTRPAQIDFATIRETAAVTHPEHAPAGQVRIAFMGVWDTVDAVGLPFQLADVINTTIYRFKFPDTTLSPPVSRAGQALALDEERESFAPVLWDEAKSSDPTRIEQVWFAGVHSNVGGGYPKQGMSLVALDWMMAKATAEGVRLLKPDFDAFVDHLDVHDKLYDPRAGAGIFFRWQPRNVAELCARCGVVPKVHASAFERLARNTEGYACGTVPFNCSVVGINLPPAIATDVERVVQTGAMGTSLVGQRSGVLRWGQISYWLCLGAVAGAAVSGLWLYASETRKTMSGWRAAASVAAGFFNGRWFEAVAGALWAPEHRWIVYIAATALGIAYLLELVADHAMDDGFSEFWHARQQALRRALRI